MIINDSIFGKLNYSDNWSREIQMRALGKKRKIELIVKGSKEGDFDKKQYKAYEMLIEKWDNLQIYFLQYIFEEYKQRRAKLLLENKVDDKYPLIEKKEELVDMMYSTHYM